MNYFNANMTCDEARNVLFTIIEGKGEDEIEKIKEEYSSVLPTLYKNDVIRNKGYLTQ